VKVAGSLDCSDHQTVIFRILCGGSRGISRIKTLDFRRAYFGLFKELFGGIPWVRALEGRGVQESKSLFKHHFLHAQDQCIPLRKKSRRGGRRPAWMSKELLVELRWKRKVYGMWKEGQATWEEYRNAVRTCRDATRKAKVHLCRVSASVKGRERLSHTLIRCTVGFFILPLVRLYTFFISVHAITLIADRLQT